MIDHQHLDIRTITMGISLLGCADPNPDACAKKIYDTICRRAERLVPTGEAIERELGIPIVNKRISVTPMAIVAGAAETQDYVPFARAMDRARNPAASTSSAASPRSCRRASPPATGGSSTRSREALAETELVCSSVNVGSTKAGINMDAVRLMGRHREKDGRAHGRPRRLGCAKLVVFCNASRTTPSWRARSTAWASRTASSTSACPARASCRATR
jgi:uncharacterized protein (UPF0210 family)